MKLPVYVFSSQTRADEWISAAAPILRSVERAREMLTRLCGFSSWEVFTLAIGRIKASEYDEEVGEKILLQRQKWYVLILTRYYDLDNDAARHFISSMSPSMKGVFLCPFEVSDDNYINYNIDSTFSDNYQGLDIDQLIGSISQHWSSDPRRLQSSFTISGLTWVHTWEKVLTKLGWLVRRCEEEDGEEYDNYFPDIGQPSLSTYEGPTNNPVPIYLCSAVRTPGELRHPPTLLFMKACVGDLIMNWPDTRYCIIFWGYPQRATFNRIPYCCLGVLYDAQLNRWKDLFFNEDCNSFGRLLELNESVTDIISGQPKLADVAFKMSTSVAHEFCPSPVGAKESDIHLEILQIKKGWERVRAVYGAGGHSNVYLGW
ncbi:hypothetical protein ACNFIA_17385 [Pseudomonas sp. NY15437]|uniref:hypothetical protein n=1 Tax=Pseudomonas sp. NY15437 TaxID=3400360 RepID=UPI003A8A43E8